MRWICANSARSHLYIQFQKELDDIKLLWNVHSMRRTKHPQICCGRPLLMYTSPGDYGTSDFLCRVGGRYIDACKEECIFKDNDSYTNDHDVNDLCVVLMEEQRWSKAQCPVSGRDLYTKLREEIMRLLL